MARKLTYKEIMTYLDQMETRIQNNQKAIYDLREEFGLVAQIPTLWSVFSKSLKNTWLKIKITVASKI